MILARDQQHAYAGRGDAGTYSKEGCDFAESVCSFHNAAPIQNIGNPPPQARISGIHALAFAGPLAAGPRLLHEQNGFCCPKKCVITAFALSRKLGENPSIFPGLCK